MYFVFIYENRIMKPVEIVLRRGRGDEGEQWRDGGSKSIVSTYIIYTIIQCTHLYSYYMLTIKKIKNLSLWEIL
jgi:hypothetical protein